jgi:hypothetical protein
MMKSKVSKPIVKLVESIIKRHNEACSSLVEFNKFWRLVIFVIYQGYQPMFCILLLQAIMIDASDKYGIHWFIYWFIKICMAFGAVCVICAILVFALSAEIVSTQAFSIYPKLGKLIVMASGKLDVKVRMNLQNLMIRVSTEKIGFTSYDLFVVDRKAVYQVTLKEAN